MIFTSEAQRAISLKPPKTCSREIDLAVPLLLLEGCNQKTHNLIMLGRTIQFALGDALFGGSNNDNICYELSINAALKH